MKNSKRKNRLTVNIILFSLLIITLLTGYFFFRVDDDRIMKAYFTDVGQGDCTVFINGDYCLLIDCGESEYSDKIVAELKGLNIKTVNTVIITHPHTDHYGGLSKIADNFNIEYVIVPEIDYYKIENKSYVNLLSDLKSRDIKVQYPLMNYDYTVNNIHFKFISPLNCYDDMNDNSLVTVVRFGENIIYMAADSGNKVEQNILQQYNYIDCDILKAGHHGSSTSSSDDFIKSIKPEIAVISVGENNPYYLPSEYVIKRLYNSGCKIYRTDNYGTVVIKFYENSYKIL